MKRKRDPLSRSAQLWFYLGSTVALVVLVLLGYRFGRNLALPAFLLFLVIVTVAGARQERAARRIALEDQALQGEDSEDRG